MEDKCPKCGETLITKSIQKKIGSGTIDYPIAQACPKCKWSKDLTGAGDIVGMPVMADAGESRKEEILIPKQPASTAAPQKPVQFPGSTNILIPIILAILVVGAIAWVFFLNPAQEEQVISTQTPVATPVITQTPVQTPGSTPAPEVTPSGNQSTVKLETVSGFTPKTRTIQQGDRIVWTNEGTYAVTLVSKDGLFEEKILNNAKQMNYTFLYSGTFSFYLKNNTNLTGTIVVEP
jgi:plastocyanin/DNA-directed RNA polymerase subunit M/transcription elongation factor TFIIS